MATIDDLKSMAREPTTIDEWLSRFSDEDRLVIQDAMLRHDPSKVHPILTELEENPFPFTAAAISNWRRR